LSVDAKARKLYVTHATKIVIVDLAEDKIAGEIADTPGVHGFAIASDLGPRILQQRKRIESKRG